MLRVLATLARWRAFTGVYLGAFGLLAAWLHGWSL